MICKVLPVSHQSCNAYWCIDIAVFKCTNQSSIAVCILMYWYRSKLYQSSCVVHVDVLNEWNVQIKIQLQCIFIYFYRSELYISKFSYCAFLYRSKFYKSKHFCWWICISELYTSKFSYSAFLYGSKLCTKIKSKYCILMNLYRSEL